MDTIPQDNTSRKQCSNPDCANPWLPATPEFFRRDRGKLTSRCKACLRQQEKARYRQPAVHEKALAQGKEYRNRPGVHEHSLAYKRAYYSQPENREHMNAYGRAYHSRPEIQAKAKVQQRIYIPVYRSRPGIREHIRAYERSEVQRVHRSTRYNQRRAASKSIPGTLSLQQIEMKLRLQRFRCYYCSRHFEKRNGKYLYHLEHTVPISRKEAQPRHDINYVVLACPTCNLKKGTRLPHEFYEGGRLL